MQEELKKLIETMTAALVDAEKQDKGNQSAGVRFRNALISVEKASKAVRAKSLQMSKGEAK